MTERTFTVAVTGHRPNRLRIAPGRLTRRLWLVLDALRAGASGRGIALTGLAEGADRLFADAALKRGYAVRALLPFALADYKTTFAADDGALEAYLPLMDHVREMPGRLVASTDAYVALGQELVAAADIIIAVWDGAPAAGRGGTPDVMEQALQRGTPVVWVDAVQNRLPRRIARSDRVSLDRRRDRAEAMTRRALIALAQHASART
jgi:hypothetical protein